MEKGKLLKTTVGREAILNEYNATDKMIAYLDGQIE